MEKPVEGSRQSVSTKMKYIVLWLTEDCNLRCRYCYANAGAGKKNMTFETARRALELVGKESFKLELAGGEPLINMSLVRDIYNYVNAGKIHAALQLQTNGCLITPELAGEIKRMGISIGVSLDGPAGVNDFLRGNTSGTFRGLRLLSEYGVRVNINCVLTSLNVKHLPELADIALFFGNVEGIGIDLLRTAGRAVENAGTVSAAEPQDIAKYLKMAHVRSKALEEAVGKKMVFREIEDARKRIVEGKSCGAYCHAVNGASMVVLPGGNAYPCGSLAGIEEFRMGNVYSPGEIRQICLPDTKPQECLECRYGSVCRRACPSRLILKHPYGGGLSRQDCILRKTAFEIAEKELEKEKCQNECD